MANYNIDFSQCNTVYIDLAFNDGLTLRPEVIADITGYQTVAYNIVRNETMGMGNHWFGCSAQRMYDVLKEAGHPVEWFEGQADD